MTGIRRVLVLIGLTPAVLISAAIPASASFADGAAVSTTVVAGTVQAPSGLILDDSCSTTTTTTKQTIYTNPGTGEQIVTYYSSTTSTSTSASNVQGTSTTTVAGPGPSEQTTTTVSKNTNLHVSLRWTGSTSRGVTGYVVSAHLGVNNTISPLMTTTSLSVSQVQDADNLWYQPSLLVTTRTSYGWTADSARTRVLAC